MSVRINDDWYNWKGFVFDKGQVAHILMIYEMIGDEHPRVGGQGGVAGWLENKCAACQEADEDNDPGLILWPKRTTVTGRR